MSDDQRVATRRRRRRTRRTVFVVLVGCLIGWLVWLIGFSSVLGVRQIDVDGVALVSADDVIRAAGLATGQPMIRVSPATLADSITETLPEVLSVTVDRQWPGTVALHVTERIAVFQVAVGDQFGMVSADGTVFHFGDMKPHLLVARVMVGDPALLSEVAAVVVSLPAELTPHVLHVSAATRDSVTVQLDESRLVVWGSASQGALKAEVLLALLSVPGSVYDVSAPTSPAVR